MNPIAKAEFVPRRWLRNGHAQTIAGNYLPRRHALPPPVVELVAVSAGAPGQAAAKVLCHCHWQPAAARASRPTVILLHGLEGSSQSQYVRGNGSKMWGAGCNVVRMNMRNCGGTEGLSPTLYHSGLSGDVLAVMNFFLVREGLQSVSLVGYSMGGNLVLKLAGDMGAEAPAQLRSVVGVSPAVDLAASADALHAPSNRLYERRFLRALLRRFRRKAALFPALYQGDLGSGIRSLREFDDRITARYSGFTGADEYYSRAGAASVLGRIAVPTLILHALDDPFIRLTRETRGIILGNPRITYLETAHGGHCAFLADPDPGADSDGYWAEGVTLRFVLEHAGVETAEG